MSSKTGNGIDCEEKVVSRSGLDCCIICQKVEEKEITLAIAGASYTLLVNNGIGK